MFNVPSFFGGDSGVTYEQLQERKRIARELMGDQGQVRTVGEGINQASSAIAGALMNKKAAKEESKQRDAFNTDFNAAISGMLGGYSPRGSSMSAPTSDFKPVEGGMSADQWEAIKQGIFAGESGGDYNALYGYRNRQPGAPQVSQMTVGEVMDFTQPGGEYGQSVKGEIGRVATPVGAYQVVGTTLRDAVNALGIDPNTPFDQATQDRIGQYIYQTQGTGAWEGYKGPRMSTQGVQTAQMGGVDPAVLAQLSGLASNPYATPGQQAIVQALIGQQLQAMQPADPMDALQQEKMRLEIDAMRNPQAKPQDPTSLMQNYEYAVNVLGMSPDEARAWVKGGQTINVGGNQAETEYAKTRGKGLGEYMNDIQTQGDAANSALASLDIMERAIEDPNFYSGAGGESLLAAKRAAIALGLAPDEAVEGTEVFNSQAKKAALDVMGGSLGTGFSNADRDFVIQQVPNLQNTPEGNKLLIEVQRGLQTRKREIAALARKWEADHNGSLTGFRDALAKWAEANPIFGDDFMRTVKEAETAPSGETDIMKMDDEGLLDFIRKGIGG